MAKVKEGIASVTQKVFDLLEPFESAERRRVVAAVLTLLGESAVSNIGVGGGAGQGDGGNGEGGAGQGDGDNGGGGACTPQQFFNEKDPQTKGEELAVAARYREQHKNFNTHQKDDLRNVIREARRNFDDNHFRRDLGNAKTKGLFNKGKENTLAYYGQHYVDALPDRVAARKIRKPKRASKKTKAKKKKSNK